MKWYMHNNDMRFEPEMLAALERGGVALYGAAQIVFEVLCKNGAGEGQDFSLPMTGKHDLEFWRRELRTKTTKATKDMLEQLAECGVISKEYLGVDTVSAPMLKEHVDAWTRRKKKKRGEEIDNEAAA